MKEIKLSNSKEVAIVDDEDYELVSKYKWRLQREGNCNYAVTGDKIIRMHRLILGVTDPKMWVDHVRHDTLNNRRCNIRIATGSQNSANRRKQTGCTSRYKGVSFHKTRGKWLAQIRYNDKRYHLGLFKTELEAASAYNAKATEFFGEFAKLNQI